MTLPDVCPRDGVSHCKKKACHLYVVEWRTEDEQCVIGYSSTHKQLSKSTPMEDTYAEKTRTRIETNMAEKTSWPKAVSEGLKREHLKRAVPDVEVVETYVEAKVEAPSQGLTDESVTSVRHEEVVVSNKDTTVIESRQNDGDKGKEDRKRKSLDEVMDLDLPEGYEEEFWK
ncbi:hypothetical protein [Methanolobus sp.]|uniref:hypothetical protein n=1 Tax=Methanolobus sp. TaxID=1874737 RepID=UPI0025FD4B1D|nr:hypothetical protein [Methanolobus sp.]